MNQTELRRRLDTLAESLNTEDKDLLDARLAALASAYPFNEYEFIISFLIDRGILAFAEYEKLRNEYVSSNRYLELFNLSPRIFGQIWGEKHLQDLDARFRKPDKELDPDFDGEYDLWLEGVKIEVKAARAVDRNRQGPIVSRALHWRDDRPFWMNFQQIKLNTCDAFVLIGVWVDRIVYWVLTREEIVKNPYLSHQHRGGVEYQIGITSKNIDDFEPYRVEGDEIADVILRKMHHL